MDDPKEDIQIFSIEENLSFHSVQKFSSDSSIINYVHSLAVIAPGKGEEFDFSVSNDVSGVKIINYLDILEIILDFRSDLILSSNKFLHDCMHRYLGV